MTRLRLLVRVRRTFNDKTPGEWSRLNVFGRTTVNGVPLRLNGCRFSNVVFHPRARHSMRLCIKNRTARACALYRSSSFLSRAKRHAFICKLGIINIVRTPFEKLASRVFCVHRHANLYRLGREHRTVLRANQKRNDPFCRWLERHATRDPRRRPVLVSFRRAKNKTR